MKDFEVLLFYKYVTIENPQELATWVRKLCEQYALTGRVIVAEEGINAILEGKTANTKAFLRKFLSDARLSDIKIKRSKGTGTAFPKLSVKVRKEIVGTHFPQEQIDPRIKTAPYIKANELRKMYESDDDFVVVDMRNTYEYASGHFKHSVNPGLENSRDLPKMLPKLEPLKHRKVITVCTGGIRCEKMSALLLSNGFEDVHQLEGGIHGYMKKFPGKDFLGTLYTFDGRLTVDFGGNREVIGKCYLCDNPTERYVNCANPACHLHFLVCDSCVTPDGNAYCSNDCKRSIAIAITIEI